MKHIIIPHFTQEQIVDIISSHQKMIEAIADCCMKVLQQPQFADNESVLRCMLEHAAILGATLAFHSLSEGNPELVFDTDLLTTSFKETLH